jgi:UDP-3-O-[3-hydroxymyristoyl] glucosamine N-acyltransferase
MKERETTVREIAGILQLDFTGRDIPVDGLNLCNRPSEHNSIISYITAAKYAEHLKGNTKVKGLFIAKGDYETVAKDYPDLTCFIVDRPEEVFYRLHSYLYHHTSFYARPKRKPQIGRGCDIHATAVIDDDVTIGNNVTIGACSIIKRGAIIGDNTAIGCGSIVGADGFQLLKDKGGNNYLAEHVGGCKLGANVYVGNNVVISISLFEGYTVVGNNTKIDNLVHISHNCLIGDNCVLTGGVILAGSTILEDNVWIAPNATVYNKVVLEKGVSVGIGSVVIGDVRAGCSVFGVPARKII